MWHKIYDTLYQSLHDRRSPIQQFAIVPVPMLCSSQMGKWSGSRVISDFNHTSLSVMSKIVQFLNLTDSMTYKIHIHIMFHINIFGLPKWIVIFDHGAREMFDHWNCVYEKTYFHANAYMIPINLHKFLFHLLMTQRFICVNEIC